MENYSNFRIFCFLVQHIGGFPHTDTTTASDCIGTASNRARRLLLLAESNNENEFSTVNFRSRRMPQNEHRPRFTHPRGEFCSSAATERASDRTLCFLYRVAASFSPPSVLSRLTYKSGHRMSKEWSFEREMKRKVRRTERQRFEVYDKLVFLKAFRSNFLRDELLCKRNDDDEKGELLHFYRDWNDWTSPRWWIRGNCGHQVLGYSLQFVISS